MKPIFKILVLICASSISHFVLSQTPAIEWQRGIGGTSGSGHNILIDIHQTKDGGYICGGSSDANRSTSKSQDSKGDYDYWIVKLDKYGNIQWEKTFGGNDIDILNSISQTNDGGYIVGGSSGSNISGDKTENSRFSYLYNNSMDYWILKLDENGNIVWQKTIGSDGWENLSTIKQLPNAQYIIAGTSNGIISHEKTLKGYGSYDYWILKLDENGNILWQNIYGGESDDFLSAHPVFPFEKSGNIDFTDDGGFIIGGKSGSNISGNKTENKKGFLDYWVLRVDSIGSILWQKTFGGLNYSRNNFSSLIVTKDNNYMVGGYTDTNIGGDKTQPSNGNFDFWILKLDRDGNILWQKSIGALYDESLYSFNQTNDGGYILAGESNSDISGDKTENARFAHDYWVVKLDKEGNVEWDKTLGALGEETAYGVLETNDGGFVVGGYSGNGYISYDKTESSGASDYWILKLLPCKKTIVVNDTICFGQAYILPKGNTVSLAGNYYDTLITSRNCDSIIITNLIVRPTSYQILNKNLCIGQSFTLSNGSVITSNGIYKDTIPNICDSIIEYRLSFLNNITTTENPTICRGKTYTLPNGNIVSVAGIYRDTLQASFGCDSIVVTNLSVTSPIPFNNNVTICSGKIFTRPNGNIVSTAGVYYDTLKAPNTCDSIVITNLTVTPYLQSSQITTVCLGKSFVLPNGRSVSQNGIYKDTVRNNFGCDSIITTNLTITNPIPFTNTTAICEGQKYTLPNGNNVSIAGTYTDTIKQTNTCDSVVITNLTVFPNTFQISLNPIDTIDAGNSIELKPSYSNQVAVSWNWSPTTYLSCSTCENPIATPTQNSLYTVKAISTDGCEDTAQTAIVLRQSNVYVPTSFTPNNDGLNDALEIFANNPATFSIKIYNRWGELVFQSIDITDKWNGTFKGENCPVDTYIFTLELTQQNGKQINENGSILLLR